MEQILDYTQLVVQRIKYDMAVGRTAILIAGKEGQGKTTLALYMAEQINPEFDIYQDYHLLGDEWDRNRSSIPVIFDDITYTKEDLWSIAERCHHVNRLPIFVLSGAKSLHPAKEFWVKDDCKWSCYILNVWYDRYGNGTPEYTAERATILKGGFPVYLKRFGCPFPKVDRYNDCLDLKKETLFKRMYRKVTK